MTDDMPFLQRQHGFTLVELIVTLAILGVLAGIGLPSMSGMLVRSELSATTNGLVYSLQMARSEAIKRAVPVAVCPSRQPLQPSPNCGGSFQNGWIVFVDEDGNGTRSGNDEVLLHNEAPSDAFSITGTGTLSKQVIFSAPGGSVNVAGVPLSGAIVVDHSDSKDQRVIQISASGRVMTER